MNRRFLALLVALIGVFIACTPHVQVDVSSPASRVAADPGEPRVGGFVNPNFLGNDITTTGNLLVGATPRATAGTLRTPDAFTFKRRNHDNSADETVIEGDGASSQLWIGSKINNTEHIASVIINSNSSSNLYYNGSARVSGDGNGVTLSGTRIKLDDSTALQVGNTAPAQSGDIRFRNNRSMAARNAADSADVRILLVDTSNRIVLGENAASRSYIDLGVDSTFVSNNGEIDLVTAAVNQPIVLNHGSAAGALIQKFGGTEYQRTIAADVQTTDATVTTLASGTVATNTMLTIEVDVTAKQSTFTNTAGYKRIATARDSGGILNLVGTVTAPHTVEAVAGWDCTIDVSANDWRVRVTGAAATTINWRAVVRLMKNRRRRRLHERRRDIANDNHLERLAA